MIALFPQLKFYMIAANMIEKAGDNLDKTALRKEIREKKRAMAQEDIRLRSQRLTEKFLQSDSYNNAKTIYGYLPYNQEVLTWDLLRRAMEDGKRVAVPKVYEKEMKFIYITDFSQVSTGYCGIPEPVEDGPVAEDREALVLMPGLAFDREGHRIGYGGGFYDRFLSDEPNHPTIALCYDFQVQEDLPVEEFDIPVDMVIWD